MNESVMLPCFFCGADMDDDLDHYLECEEFWTLLISSAGLSHKGTRFLNLPPTERLGLLNPSTLTCKLLAGAHLVYHALKFDHMAEVHSALASSDLHPIYDLTIRLAVHHYRDLICFRDISD